MKDGPGWARCSCDEERRSWLGLADVRAICFNLASMSAILFFVPSDLPPVLSPVLSKLSAVGRPASLTTFRALPPVVKVCAFSSGACCAYVTTIFLPRTSLPFAVDKALCAS